MSIFKLDGTVVSANRAAARILGCEVEELIGHKVSDFLTSNFTKIRCSGFPSSPWGRKTIIRSSAG